MKRLACDIETDTYVLEELTTCHSIVLRNLDNLEDVLSCAEQPGYRPFSEALAVLQGADLIVMHNGIRFDKPALEQLFPGFILPAAKLYDSLTVAQFRWAHIEELDFERHRKGKSLGKLIGSHSIEAWGMRLGVQKVGTDIEDWSTWTRNMQARCEVDTLITAMLYHRIQKAGGTPDEALLIEHELAEYLFHQEKNGWPFDLEKAVEFQAMLAEKREKIGLEMKTVFGSWLQPERKKGQIVQFSPKRSDKKKGWIEGAPMSRLKLIEFTPTNRNHITNRLKKLYGWVPTAFTPSGLPEVDDDLLKGLPYPTIPLICEYLLLDKRLKQLAEGKKAWLKFMTFASPAAQITRMPHIHGRIWQNGTVTHRGAHVDPNIGQVPKVGNPYGAECRELFCVPKGWVQIGADASGLELRCLAHYMARYDDGAYALAVVQGKQDDGTDVHSLTQKAIIEFVGPGKKGRDTAKTFIYAFLYGAGDEKLGSIVAPIASPEKQKMIGAKLRKQFLKGLPALGYLVDAVKKKAEEKGYLLTLDGRRVYIRAAHAALNSLLQTAGAIICKRWLVESNRRLITSYGPQGWLGQWAALAWVHDETQKASRPAIKEGVAAILVDSIRHMTQHFSLRCPLDGEAKFGQNWKMTH